MDEGEGRGSGETMRSGEGIAKYNWLGSVGGIEWNCRNNAVGERGNENGTYSGSRG